MEATVENRPDLIAGFLDEAEEHIAALNRHLLFFEAGAEAGTITFRRDEDRQRITEMFGTAHSLKELSATFGFADINRLTHSMETLFGEARDQKRSFDPDTLASLLSCVDTLDRLVAELTTPSDTPPDAEAAMRKLEAILADQTGDTAVAEPENAEATLPPEDPAVPAEPPSPLPPTDPAEPTRDGAATAASYDNLVLDDPELRTLFIETTEESIDELDGALLKLEQDAGEEILNEVFRVAHTLKGACGAAGLQDVQRLTHQMETAFDALRSGRLSLCDTLMAGFLKVADRLREVVDQVRDSRYVPWSDDQVQAVLANSTQDSDKPESSDPVQPASPPPPNASSTAGLAPGQPGYCIRLDFDAGNADRDLQAYVIYNRLKALGDVVHANPDIEGAAEIDTQLEVVLSVPEACEAGAAEIRELVDSFEVPAVHVAVVSGEIATTSIPSEAAEPPHAAEVTPAQPQMPTDRAAAASSTASPASPEGNGAPIAERRATVHTMHDTIRVDVDRLDQLMNLGGELVINRARFQQVERTFKDVFTGKDASYITAEIASRLDRLTEESRAFAGRSSDKARTELTELAAGVAADFAAVRQMVDKIGGARTALHDFSEAVATLDRIAEGLQKRIMDTRMVPVGPLFTRFRRVVRDIAKELGKKINLQIRGEHTELDKRMIDELGDPLTHIIRNAADHGIEMPDARTASGKPAAATISLEAYHQGNTICIEVRDDGCGIDLDAIRRKIADRELAAPTQIEQMSDREVVQYIFHPGFSTAKQVSDLSGRGMGMDIVTTKIAKLNGVVEVDTKPGEGTTVTLKLPLTLAIVASILTRIGEATYAIPLESVAEIITIRRDEIRTIQRQKVVKVRGQVVPIFLLEDLMNIAVPALRTASSAEPEWTLVVVASQNERIGLIVDQMIGQEEIVIKSLAENYRNVAGFAGATIMGDGRVALILDAAYFLSRNARPDERTAEAVGGTQAI